MVASNHTPFPCRGVHPLHQMQTEGHWCFCTLGATFTWPLPLPLPSDTFCKLNCSSVWSDPTIDRLLPFISRGSTFGVQLIFPFGLRQEDFAEFPSGGAFPDFHCRPCNRFFYHGPFQGGSQTTLVSRSFSSVRPVTFSGWEIAGGWYTVLKSPRSGVFGEVWVMGG